MHGAHGFHDGLTLAIGLGNSTVVRDGHRTGQDVGIHRCIMAVHASLLAGQQRDDGR